MHPTMYHGFIYVIKNSLNTHLYAGSTIKPLDKKFKEHVEASKNPTSNFDYFMALHGAKNFFIEALYESNNITLVGLKNMEQSIIKVLGGDEKVFTCAPVTEMRLQMVLDVAANAANLARNQAPTTEQPLKVVTFQEVRDKILDDTNNMSKIMVEIVPNINYIGLTKSAIQWLGFKDSISFIKFLKRKHIEFEWINVKSPTFHLYETLRNVKRGITMEHDHFQKMINLLKTNRGKELEKYKASIDHLETLYKEYTFQVQVKKIHTIFEEFMKTHNGCNQG